MSDPIDSILDGIIEREGGFVDHAADKGGPTKFGITQATLGAWRKSAATVTDVEQLSVTEARAIYRRQYVEAPGLDKIANDKLRHLLVDCAVHSSPAKAVRWLQQAMSIAVDGVLGPATLAEANAADGARIYALVLATRIRFLGRLITDKPSQAVFAAGWMARCASFVEGL